MAASSQLLHHLFHPPQSQPPPPPSSFFSLFLRFKPLFRSKASTITTTTALSKSSVPQIPLRTTTHFTNFLPTPLFSQSFSTLTPSPLPAHGASSTLQEGEETEEDDDEENFDDGVEEYDGEVESGSEDPELGGTDGETSQVMIVNSSPSLPLKLPGLSVKEKKELASYAHSLGKKLKSQLVGKSGVTGSVATSFIETLEANELLKIKIHRTCPGELDDVVKQLEEATGSVVVGQIGRTVIIYRPSLTKLKAEEKKKQARKVFVRREPKLKPTLQSKGQVSRLSGRGRRGSSRF
ncbi:hypothetical protein I3760_06G132200 [Carya illinoinensis]|uniref:CRM domain-containing protein n=1 Tax=Carya illinoinensis TaxID=32201 RepID=A0A8T1QBL4_CARIL|nr:uncharacterized protein LOC122314030 [Carya illinoinensis]KAG2703294.1 hypothetical protein I3760_06G132200 [Carya illinoinensis]KAG6651694.1 hypothetical protein CIPAW_06G130600 [Carya illinoinensis]KAG6709391.1 hypothetical protein I3842_06G130900 [Carya illinoinensis]